MDKSEIGRLLNKGDIDSAEKVADEMLAASADDVSRAEALYMQGRVAWKKGDKAMAISLYSQASALDSHSEAAIALEQARNIMDFYNKDLYNP